MSGKWQYSVVKTERGDDGKWFSYRPTMRTTNFEAARAFAMGFAYEQRTVGVTGARINVLTRGGKSVAEYRVEERGPFCAGNKTEETNGNQNI